MYINYILTQSGPFEMLNTVKIQDSTKRFFVDLYQRYRKKLDIPFDKNRYRFETLGNYFFNLLSNTVNLTMIDYLIFSSNNHFYDTAYASPELYFKNTFTLRCDMCDIKKGGRLHLFTAIHVLKILFCQPALKQGICISIENVNNDGFLGAIGFSKIKNNESKWQVEWVDILSEKNLATTMLNIIQDRQESIYGYFHSSIVELISKLAKYYTLLTNNDLSPYLYLKAILNNNRHDTVKNILIIDFDKKFNLFGVILLNQG